MAAVALLCHKSNLNLHLKRTLANTDPTTNTAPTTRAIDPVGCVAHNDGR